MVNFWIRVFFFCSPALGLTDLLDPSAIVFDLPLITLNKKSGELSKKKCSEYYPDGFGIAGGSESLPKEYPHMAAIGYGDEEDVLWLCGGALISKKFILTAAHCLSSRQGPPKFVRLGDLDLLDENDDAFPQNFTVIRSIPHPLYKPPAKYHDIGLLELDREAQLNLYVAPACLNTEKELEGAGKLTATGWGKTGYTDASSSFLLKVELDHVPHSKCVELFGKYSSKDLPEGINEDFQICAGTVKGKDTCPGDSGGPLQVKNQERSRVVNVHNIVAITSFGKACALSGTPGIYSRVSNYIPWIESIVWQNQAD